MKERRKWRMVFLTGVAVLICRAVLALTICRKCGHEVDDGVERCGHCREPVVRKESAPPPAPEPAAAETEPVAKLTDEFVRDQYDRAQECQAQDPGVAYAYYQNAFAVLRLVPADERSKRIGEALMRHMGECRKAMCIGRVPCRVCKGTGNYKVDVGKVSGTKNIKFVDGIQCKRCRGLGYSMTHLSVDRIKMNFLKGRQSFEQRQMVANSQRLGRAFVTQEIFDALSLRQRVMVMTGMPAPCQKCQSTGLETCRTCRGTGWDKCPAENCRDGVIEQPNTGAGRSSMTKKRLNSDLQELCGMCQGWGEIPCRVCQGKACTICAACGGTGDAPRCNRCSGAGLTPCTRCNGTGDYRGAKCDRCAGEGALLCTTCKGEGSVSR